MRSPQPNRGVFRTFCHINEYDEWGYANLHRMIAMSDPLYLWGPSTQLLAKSRISEVGFLSMVESGRIRIISRESWWNQRQRNTHKWKGAQWNPDVDPQLVKIAREDEKETRLESRRVIIAPDETGLSDAQRIFDEVEGAADKLKELIAMPAESHFIPAGVIEAAHRAAPQGDVAAYVLRNALNHADAISLVQPNAPFFLGDREGPYLSKMDSLAGKRVFSRGESSGSKLLPPAATSAAQAVDLSHLTSDVRRLLELLEHQTSPSLTEFVGSGGHGDLVEWLRQLCGLVELKGKDYELNDLIDAIDKDAVRGRVSFQRDQCERIKNAGTATGGLGLSVASAIEAHGSLSILALSTFIFGEIVLGAALYGLGRSGQLSPVVRQRQTWPFLYAMGTKHPNRNQIGILKSALDSLATN